MSNDFCPIQSKDVQICQVMSNYVQKYPIWSKTYAMSRTFAVPLLVLVALGLVSQHVSAAGTPYAVPLYVDVTDGASLCSLPVP